MRLFNVETLRLQNFTSSPVPEYAVLSHTHGSDEITYEEVRRHVAPNKDFPSAATRGWKKLKALCSKARSHGFKWVWLDCCCIDRSDAVELGEALNSMFRWYRGAVVCYAHLEDVDGVKLQTEEEDKEKHSAEDEADALAEKVLQSRWFRRGWTLAELIAPPRVVFLDKNWEDVGTRASLAKRISEKMGIPSDVLLGNVPGQYSVAQVMSWAAGRKTSKPEDAAYSLLGLLGISMPILYGEGGQAFQRLQHEIIKKSGDQSIFAWCCKDDDMDEDEDDGRGPFAASPDEFKGCGDIRRCADLPSAEYSLGNRGLKITLPCHEDGDTIWGLLKCHRGVPLQDQDGEDSKLNPLYIHLRRTPSGRYRRIRCNKIGLLEGLDMTAMQTKTILIEHTNDHAYDAAQHMQLRTDYSFTVQYSSCLTEGYKLAAKWFMPDKDQPGWQVHPPASTLETKTKDMEAQDDVQKCIIYLDLEESGRYGALLFHHEESHEKFVVVAGVHNYVPWVDIETEFLLHEATEEDDGMLLDYVAKCYYPTHYDDASVDARRNWSPWDGLDRVTRRLGSGSRCTARMDSVMRGEKRIYSVDIRVNQSKGRDQSFEVVDVWG